METEKGNTPKSKKKKRRAGAVILFILIGLSLMGVLFSLIGRISPDSVIPDSFTAYVSVPDPVRLAERLLSHESLEEVLAESGWTFLLPAASRLREGGLLQNRWIRFAARGALDGASLPEGMLAAWDARFLSPLLRLLPFIAGRITVPNLYYVQAGKNSRFEYRMENGDVYYIGPYRNLLIASNNSELFESVINGRSREGDTRRSFSKTLRARDFDIALLVSQEAIRAALAGADPKVAFVLDQLQFPGLVEAALTILPNKLELSLASPLSSTNRALQRLIEQDAEISSFTRFLPENTQYSTLLSAGTLQELFDAAASIFGPEMDAALKRADSSARLLFRLNLEDLLFSWTAREFAVFGMEGRPSPVYVIKVGDEQKRQEVFDRAFRSVFLSENTRAVLDGTRIPQIEIPDFINAILRILGINAPAPYYVVQDGYLFISDSADALLASINAIRKNAVLPKSTLWQDLSKSGSDKSSFSLFYSLDRSLPFFLRGNTAFNTLLRLYRQGLVRLGFEKNTLRVFLSAVPGTGRGIRAVPGYPLDLQGRAGSAVYGVFSERRESRLLLTRDNSALAINPANRDLYELKNPFPVTVIPAAGLAAKTMNDGAAWVAGGGQVILVNGNMEPVNGFPLITGVRTASPPSAHGGKLYLPDEDGPLYVVNADTTMSLLETGFIAGLRSPPVFLDAGGKTYMASYAKSLPGEIWLQDDGGNTYPGWPITVSRIAFGSPLLFAQDGGVFLAFITQRGDLNLYDEGGMPRQNFPITLPGVFFVQPVFDGESLWTAASDGTLYQVQLDGTVLHQRIPNLKVEEAGRINAVDVDGDGKAEIFVTGEGNALYGYSRNFSSLDGFPLPVWGQPAFADLNGDGKIECTGIGLDNRLYQWQFK